MSRFVSLIAIALVAAFVAGCADQRGSAPVDRGAAERSRGAGTYVVQRGDNIYGIARQHNISVRALIDANHLQPPFQVTPGQVLVLSTSDGYTVARGDTLLGVAKKTGVSFSTLARANNLSPPYTLRVGQHLILPGGGEAMASGSNVTVIQSAQSGSAATTPVAVAPVSPAGTSAAPSNPSSPAPSSQAAAPVPATKDQGKSGYVALAERNSHPAETVAPAPAAVPAPPPPPPPAAEPATPPAAAEQTASAALPVPPPKSGRGYLWPVKGTVIAEFGPTGKGQHNDGINIEVPRGTPVVAAEDGVVAYAGNELRGFGNLLLIKHADGWITAYAHNDQLLVKKGDMVKRGQRIALSGDSGGVSEPQLHFEVRQGTRAIDPMTVLSGGRASPASSLGDRPGPG